MRFLKKALKALGVGVLGLLLLAGCFVGVQAWRYNVSMERVYPIPVPAITRSTEPAVIARGEHVARSLGGCALADCHGANLSGGRTLELGPLGRFTGPNLSGIAQAYSDGELVRLIRHGVRKSGRSIAFMDVRELNWLPDEDLVALVSWIRTVPVSPRPNGPLEIGVFAKVLDRLDQIPLDVARRVDHDRREIAPPPSPTPAYGRYIARLCMGCHGEHLSGGPIPGAPASMAVPPNLTPHASGLAAWTYADFERLSREGLRKNGRRVDPIMPTEALANMNDLERTALWSYLRTLPARPFGQR